MADSINNKAKEYYDNDNTGGSLNNNLKDFLKQQGAEGNSLNTLWRNYAYGEGGNSLNTRLGKLWGTSGSLIKRWKDVLGLTWDDLKLFFNARRNDPELLLSGATSFDGTNDYIQLASDGTGKFNKQNFTISAWVKISDNGWNPIFSYDFTSHTSPYYALSVLSVATDSFLSMRLNNNGSNFEVVTSESIPVNVWTHIAVSNTNGSQKLYINGSLKKSATNTATITYYNQEVWIGKNNFATINGSISSLGFWERVLSASEIESIYWKGQYADLKNTELTNLVSWYNLKETGFGSDLVTNGDFATDSNWTKNTGWSIANGLASCNGSQSGASFLFQDIGIEVGRKYKITFDLSNYSAGSVRVRTGSSAAGEGVSGYYNANSSIEVELFGSGSGANFFFEATTSFTGSIDNVVVKEIQTPDSTGTNNGSIYGATTLTDAYSASSPFLPRIQDKATPKGAVALASGSTSFDGSDDYISIADSSDLSFGNGSSDSAFTISAWVNMDDATNFPIVMKGVYNSDAEWHLWTQGDDKLYIVLYDESVSNTYEGANTSAITSYEGKWTHITATYDGTGGTSANNGLKIYINGSSQSLTLIGSGTYVAMENLGANVEIGRTGSTYADGSIANVAIYSDVKTQSQIQDIMFSSYSTLTSALKTNLVSWYDLGSTGFGSELVTNGTFDSGITGWSSHNYTTAYQSDPIGGKSNVLKTPNSGAYSRIFPSSGNLVVGKTYKLTFEAYHDTSSADGLHLYLNTGADSQTTISASPTGQVWASFEKTFTATTTNFGIGFDGSATDYFDNISVKEIQAPDSQGDNEGSIYGATTNTGYTSSPSGVADPLNYGEVYGGNAVSFDGTNDYIDLDGFKFSGNQASFSFWVKFDSLSGNHPKQLIDLDTNRTIVYYVVGTGLSIYSNNATVTFGTLDIDTWYHIVGIFDGTTARMYVDGSQLGTDQTIVALDISSATQCKIGANFVPSGSYFDGLMSGVKIFNTALTQDQVRELYTKPELTLPTGVASSALKLDMPMQEGSGTAILDGSGNQNHGTGNGITWANGQEYGFQHPLVRSNNPMVFDGGDDIVNLNQPSNLNFNTDADDFTIAMWFKIASGDTGTLICKGGDTSGDRQYHIYYSSSDYIAVNVGGTVVNTNAYDDGNWHHVAVVNFDDSGTQKFRIYIDGSSVGLGTSGSGSNSLDVLLGARRGSSNSNTAFLFTGMMNDVAIWDSALTASEVIALYNSGLPLLPTTDSGNYASSSDLVGYWRNDGVTTWLDRSTNSNNGTVSGSPASIIVPEGLNEGRDSQGYYLTDTDSISSGIRFKDSEKIVIQDSETLDFETNDFSVAFWVYFKDRVINQGIWEKRNDTSNQIRIYTDADGYINGLAKTGGSTRLHAETNSAPSINQWTYVTWVCDRNSSNFIYVNGVAQTLANNTKDDGANSMDFGEMTIGRAESAAQYFNGYLDEFKIYKSKVLSVTEVLKNYNNGKSAHSN